MGRMFAQGWTPKKFWKRLPQYCLADILLALAPDSALEARSETTTFAPPLGGNPVEGTRIDG